MMRDSEQLRVVAIIQAKNASQSMPDEGQGIGAGQPSIGRLIAQLKKSHLIEDIAIAATTGPVGEALVRWGAANGISVICGPGDNLLSRFARAAELLDADIIVRVDSDTAAIDPELVDHLITGLIVQSADYARMDDDASGAGVEPLTRRALDKLMLDAPDDVIAREQVTGYFRAHPDFVRTALVRRPASSHPLWNRVGAA